jgi:hypothetical protein
VIALSLLTCSIYAYNIQMQTNQLTLQGMGLVMAGIPVHSTVKGLAGFKKRKREKEKDQTYRRLSASPVIVCVLVCRINKAHRVVLNVGVGCPTRGTKWSYIIHKELGGTQYVSKNSSIYATTLSIVGCSAHVR